MLFFYTVVVVVVVVVMAIHNAMCKASHSFRVVYDYSAADLEMWRSTNVHANQTKQNKNSSLKRELKRYSRLHPKQKSLSVSRVASTGRTPALASVHGVSEDSLTTVLTSWDKQLL